MISPVVLPDFSMAKGVPEVDVNTVAVLVELSQVQVLPELIFKYPFEVVAAESLNP